MTAFVDRIGRSLPRLEGKRVVLAVLEVHDVVRDALVRALPQSGCEVVLLPADSTPASVARAAADEDADAVVIGVYNGAALTLARRLSESIANEDWTGPVIFGGLLNEDEGGALPVDARLRIEALGMDTVDQIEELGPMLAGPLPRRRSTTVSPPVPIALSIAPPVPEAAPSPAVEPIADEPPEPPSTAPPEPSATAPSADAPPASTATEPAAAVAAGPLRTAGTAGRRSRRRGGRRVLIGAAILAITTAAIIAAVNNDSPDADVKGLNGVSTPVLPSTTLLASSPAAGATPGVDSPASTTSVVGDATSVASVAASDAVDLGLGVSVPLPVGWQQVAP